MTDDKSAPASTASPRFAVVGHPNKGKSSIVSTLAQDDSIYIDRISGSTKQSRSYPMSVNGDVLYELIDTPGFQRARAVLEWLNLHCDNTAQRPDAVKAFYQQHQNDPQFVNECELLKPIINGAGIIYVVDGSRPYGPEYEAEMEILRWTGKPSLALINPIDNHNYVSDWENALGQYFKTVREFDAHRAEFVKRTALLKVFGQLLPHWESALSKAVDCLQAERSRQHQQSSDMIATMIVDNLQHREIQNIGLGISPESVKTIMAEKFQAQLRQNESRCRARVEESYAYRHLQREENLLELIDTDLFDQESWYLFGLNKKQLIGLSAGAGAGAGVLVDIGLGGHSLFLGSVIGGISGGLGAWKFSKQIASFTFKGLPTGGHTIYYGPASHPNFSFVMLGRAIHHLKLVCTRTHANRGTLQLEQEKIESAKRDGGDGDNQPVLELFDRKEKTSLMSIFKDIRSNKKLLQQRQALADLIFLQAQKFDSDTSPL